MREREFFLQILLHLVVIPGTAMAMSLPVQKKANPWIAE